MTPVTRNFFPLKASALSFGHSTVSSRWGPSLDRNDLYMDPLVAMMKSYFNNTLVDENVHKQAEAGRRRACDSLFSQENDISIDHSIEWSNQSILSSISVTLNAEVYVYINASEVTNTFNGFINQ